jgi:hypothetical protein
MQTELPVEDLSSVSCHACGQYDATLRRSSHPSVVSVLVTSNASSRVGIWCARCRGIESAKATAISLIAGWWGVRGPKLTIHAIRANLAGGEQSAGNNARLLRSLAIFEVERGNPEIAATFAAAAHAVQPQRENSRLLDDLRRAGHRAIASNSPWRFAAWVPVAIVSVLLATVLLSAIGGGKEKKNDDKPTAIQRAAVLPETSRDRGVITYSSDSDASAAELEKQLTPTSEQNLARAYYNAVLREAKGEILPRVRRGEGLLDLRAKILDLNNKPAVAKLLQSSSMRGRYTTLCDAMTEATTYYHGGAPVEAIERTAGESLDTTLNIALHAIVADLRGHEERRDQLANQFDARAQSLEQMRVDLRIRGAVVAVTTKAIDACIGEPRY